MARPLRLQFPDAVYHLTSRGNRQAHSSRILICRLDPPAILVTVQPKLHQADLTIFFCTSEYQSLNPVCTLGIHKVTQTVTLCIPKVTMQPSKLLANNLAALANEDRYLFSLRDLKCVVPGQSLPAFKTMLSRCVKSGILKRVCQGIYIYPSVKFPSELVLYHTAARLRADSFNYLSLESILSDAGIISQLPMNWITMMSSGRGRVVQCGGFGTIEFIHTKKKPSQVETELFYDSDCRVWRASAGLALRDMVATGRSIELINWDVANELI